VSVQSRSRGVPFVIVAVVCAAVCALTLAAPAVADAPEDFSGTFTNCTGPAGTPSTIVWDKVSGNGGALHIVGTNETFNRQGELDLVTGAGFGPQSGLVNSATLDWASVLSPEHICRLRPEPLIAPGCVAGGLRLASFSSGVGPVSSQSRYFMVWRAPRRLTGTLSFCGRRIDPSGNKSSTVAPS